jgi:nucleotide-binding universal stress UspA family protein
VDVVRVHETLIIEELALDPEGYDDAVDMVLQHVHELRQDGIDADGHVLHSFGDHAAAARVLARHAKVLRAPLIVVGRSPHGPLVQFTEGSFTTTLKDEAPCSVYFISPQGKYRELTDEVLAELRQLR